MLLTDRFSRWADMFPVTAAEFTAEATANILVNQYIPLWGCLFVESKPGCPDRLAVGRVFSSSLYYRTERREGAESGVLELFSHEINYIKTPTTVYATLYNICNRRAVTIQTNTLPGSSQQ